MAAPLVVVQLPSGASALLSVSVDIRNRPAKGWSISRIINRAPETDSPPTTKMITTIGTGRTNRPKLANIMVSQASAEMISGFAADFS